MLVYGIKYTRHDSSWVFAEDALKGTIKGIRCAFCERPLTAQKATKDKPAHFKHQKSACKYVRIFRKIVHYFPITDYWLYGLSPAEVRLFDKLRRRRKEMNEDRFTSLHKERSNVALLGKKHPIYGYEELARTKYDTVEKLLQWKLIKITNFRLGVDMFQLSWKAKVLLGTNWSLKELYKEVTQHWENWYQRSRMSHWDDYLVKWLFNAMYDRTQDASFYLLKIIIDGKIIYKIGATILPYEKVEKWERKQLKGQGKRITIESVYFVKGISLIEPLIRLKYKKYIRQIGKQSGYFDFKNRFADFKKDLHQVTLLSVQHKEKIRIALKKAKNVGKRGKETIDEFLTKPKSQHIISYLESDKGVYSLRTIAGETGYSINTVRKVKKLWEGGEKGLAKE